ncbi:MAG: sulfatase-like hydrolase/transferase, partial [Rhodospirillales bacterium]|nr:sulfatase-like hydrolase/transferase [Rhodospirillales bacterium]
DKMAERGAKFTHFYNSSSACCTSRASLLTGAYHKRVRMTMVGPDSPVGLNPEEITIAEMLKDAGYQTAMVGKWHVGHAKNMMPWVQGFDHFFGIPVSHDYGKGGPNFPKGIPTYQKEPGQPFTVPHVIHKKDLPQVARYTERFTDKAIEYIKHRDKDKPLFLYIAHPMPHVLLAVTEPFKGSSQRGVYGDVMQELDANIGRVIKALEEEGMAKNTLVIFATDNGPWLSKGDRAGDTGGLREGKRTVFDGGVRTPGIFYWPGTIDAGQVVDTPAAVMDIFPTVARLAGGKLPEKTIDGVDICSLFMKDTGTTYDPQRPLAFYEYTRANMRALRSGKWKLVFPHAYESVSRDEHYKITNKGRGQTPLALFDMENDSGETTNLADKHPDVVVRLTKMADAIRSDIGDEATDTRATGDVREMGRGEMLEVTEEQRVYQQTGKPREDYEPKVFTAADGGTLRYRMHTPKLEAGRRYPLVLFLHGAGERGDDNAKQLVHGTKDLLTYS